MARINIDDDVESQPEFRRLIKILGYDEDKALGMLVRFWRLAQKYWGEYKLIPIEEIENWEFQPIIEARWGIIKEDGVYAKGSEERFAWYRQSCDAGKKGGRPRKDKITGKNPTVSSDNPTVRSENLLVPVPALVPDKEENTYVIEEKENQGTLPEGKELIGIWNQNRGPLPEVREFSVSRKKSAIARLRDKPDLSYWEKVVKKLAASPFCRGETGGSWRANFDFLVRPETHIKVMEGHYDRISSGSVINTKPINLEDLL